MIKIIIEPTYGIEKSVKKTVKIFGVTIFVKTIIPIKRDNSSYEYLFI
jgi:hypothetical protein